MTLPKKMRAIGCNKISQLKKNNTIFTIKPAHMSSTFNKSDV